MNLDNLAVNIVKALGHPVRFKIVKFLYGGPKCVCKINEEFQFSQANLSQHLRILKNACILKSEKVGLETHYSLYNEEIKDVLDQVEKYTSTILSNVHKYIYRTKEFTCRCPPLGRFNQEVDHEM